MNLVKPWSVRTGSCSGQAPTPAAAPPLQFCFLACYFSRELFRSGRLANYTPHALAREERQRGGAHRPAGRGSTRPSTPPLTFTACLFFTKLIKVQCLMVGRCDGILPFFADDTRVGLNCEC